FVVDVRILQELPQHVAVQAASFHFRQPPVSKMDLPVRIEARMAVDPRYDAIDLTERLTSEPLILESGVVYHGGSESAGRLIGEHVKMPALISSLGPSLRHILGDVGPDVGALGILSFNPVNVGQGLHFLLLDQLPYVAGIGADRAQYIPAVVIYHQPEKLILQRMHQAAQSCASAL